MKVIIDRSRWLRGDPLTSVLFRNRDGHMCCLGFLAKECGAEDHMIAEKASPQDVHEDVEWPPGTLVCEFVNPIDSNLIDRIMEVNDIREVADADREEWIRAGMAELGVEVEFVDTYYTKKG